MQRQMVCLGSDGLRVHLELHSKTGMCMMHQHTGLACVLQEQPHAMRAEASLMIVFTATLDAGAQWAQLTWLRCEVLRKMSKCLLFARFMASKAKLRVRCSLCISTITSWVRLCACIVTLYLGTRSMHDLYCVCWHNQVPIPGRCAQYRIYLCYFAMAVSYWSMNFTGIGQVRAEHKQVVGHSLPGSVNGCLCNCMLEEALHQDIATHQSIHVGDLTQNTYSISAHIPQQSSCRPPGLVNMDKALICTYAGSKADTMHANILCIWPCRVHEYRRLTSCRFQWHRWRNPRNVHATVQHVMITSHAAAQL